MILSSPFPPGCAGRAPSLSQWEREGGAQRRKGEGRRLSSLALWQGLMSSSFPRRRESRRANVSQAPLGQPVWIPACAAMTRRMALVAALTLTACAPTPRHGGIVSTNPCADAILAQIAPDRLAAVRQYSHDPASTSMPLALARRYPATAGTAEEVIARHPDLVITDTFAPAATRAAYERAGLKVLTLDSPATIAASEAQVLQIAAAAGVPARGRALVRAMQGAIPPATGAKPAALLYISGDLANGGGTLLDDLMTRAGFHNAAADYGLVFTGTLPIETIVAHPPRVILSDGEGRTATLRRRVLARTHAAVMEARFPRQLMNCGGPTVAPALRRLAAIRAQLLS